MDSFIRFRIRFCMMFWVGLTSFRLIDGGFASKTTNMKKMKVLALDSHQSGLWLLWWHWWRRWWNSLMKSVKQKLNLIHNLHKIQTNTRPWKEAAGNRGLGSFGLARRTGVLLGFWACFAWPLHFRHWEDKDKDSDSCYWLLFFKIRYP